MALLVIRIMAAPCELVKCQDNALRETLAFVRAFPRQALHASHLGFDHPVTGAAMAFDTPLPTDMADVIQGLEERITNRGKMKP
jgi:23S rRNA pseudouridine1911/1915/1917 synthase